VNKPDLRRYSNLVDLIGDPDNPTPLAQLTHVTPPGAELYLKLEWMNPFGSVKDRTAKWLLAGLEERGELAGKTVLEPTSGNTGIALAALCQLGGHPMTAIVPHTMPAEKTVLLRAFGATVLRTPEDAPAGRHPMDVAMDMALGMLAESDQYVMPNQYDNPDNARAHYESTGPEIWAQTEGKIRYYFAGMGTGGTLTGVGRFLKERDPSIRVIGIEPIPGHHISGLKNLEETAVPKVLDLSVVDERVYVDDAQALTTARRMHSEEALLVGSSAAACIAGATRWLAENDPDGIAVAVAPDSSMKSISYLQEILKGHMIEA
jgi:cysteine synthase